MNKTHAREMGYTPFMRSSWKYASVVVPLTAILFGYTQAMTLHAQTASNGGDLKTQIDTLNLQVKSKRGKVKELDSLIGSYKDKISKQEEQQASLQNEVLLLDNRIVKKSLDIERAKTETEALALEIDALTAQIGTQDARITNQKDIASELIRRIRSMDDVTPLEILLTKRSLSVFFDRLNELKRLQDDLMDSLGQVKSAKQALETVKKERDEKRLALIDEKKQLQKEELALESEKNSKLSLANETKSKQDEFERILSELREQQQATADEIASVESRLKEKINSIDEALARGDVLLNWPISTASGITAKFHDPSYPFRHLFEHPGEDIRTSVGTPVKAAAGGYVAWNRVGRMYGNYTMIVHPGNIATVYAHLSRFLAKPDTYVERGTVIGLSGGRPGDQGAGLSTGAHLHFEVRQNGIPVNPENFLPSISGEL